MNARVDSPKPGEASPVSASLNAVPSAANATEASPKSWRPSRRVAIMASVPVLLALVGGYFWLTGGRFVDTDNAYVRQAKAALSADISGRVIDVAVHDNEVVKAGQLLFTIDPAPYAIALEQADAALATARVGVEQLRVAYAAANSQLSAAEATLKLRQAEFDRKNELKSQGLAADASLDDVKIALQTAQNAVDMAGQQVAGATAALGGDPAIETDAHPAVRAALAAKDAAERNLAKTRVVAPADGIVSQVASLNVGQFIATGTTIASLVETDSTWVEANFKETQLTGFAAGMPAEISVDAYPGVKFAGRIASIGAATGSEFSLLPAQNATGNWVKVVQRIPVRIDLGPGADMAVLRSGMSANVSVDTGKTTFDKMH